MNFVVFSGNKDCILEPLSLPETIPNAVQESTSSLLPCIFCEECYPSEDKKDLLRHMILDHKLVISDVKLIVDFRRFDGSSFVLMLQVSQYLH